MKRARSTATIPLQCIIKLAESVAVRGTSFPSTAAVLVTKALVYAIAVNINLSHKILK
jgi:hypothetical protein